MLAVGLAFGQTRRYQFVNIDDDECVYQNRKVTDGLSKHGITSAFTQSQADSWVPLTFISHLLDWQVYGGNAGGHHLTNVLLHAAAAVLLFLALTQLTGCSTGFQPRSSTGFQPVDKARPGWPCYAIWSSAAVAALFALHPLRAESVAWVTERKDVLSGVFFGLALWAYAGYARCPFSLTRYAAVAVFFALGLMAKPMLVTLPLLLLVLDYWPLGRMGATKPRSSIAPVSARSSVAPFPVRSSIAALPNARSPVGALSNARSSIAAFWRLVLEKLPLLAVAALAAAVSLWAQGEARQSNELLPLDERIGHALVSYVAYLGRMIYPADLAVLYPRPEPGSAVVERACLAAILLAAITAAAVVWRRKHPYLLVGWLWYLAMLFPVSGVLAFGYGAMDRRPFHLFAPDRAGGGCRLGRRQGLPGRAAVALGVRRGAGPGAGGRHCRGVATNVLLAK